jgi:hypothetical protein
LVDQKPVNKYSEEDVWWTNHTRTPKLQGERLTTPKPDFTYGFPMYKSLGNLPKGAASMALFRNFSADTIRKLSGSPWELKPSLTAKIHQGDFGNMESADTMCFPWAVIEVKKRPHKQQDVTHVRDRCFQQAANASATALDIMTRLFQEPGGHISDELPPSIAFTCIGPELRLWLMFWEIIDGKKVKVRGCMAFDTRYGANHL